MSQIYFNGAKGEKYNRAFTGFRLAIQSFFNVSGTSGGFFVPPQRDGIRDLPKSLQDQKKGIFPKNYSMAYDHLNLTHIQTLLISVCV